ncbi:MAG: tetratricopeptide repeat protein [Thermodesulfobacteriota bacterium]|nr:tetratricopeptide repeat protein [Thermodesulfobacteriota bacterium]
MSLLLGQWLLSICLVLTGCAVLKTNVGYEQALNAFQSGNYGEAETHLQSELKQRPQDDKSLSLRGWIFFKMGLMEEAEKYFESASRINPKNISTGEGLAWIYYAKGLNEASEKKFRQMIDYAEKHFQNPYWEEYLWADRQYILSIHSNANYGLGLISKRMGRWEPARKYLEEAINQPNPLIDPEEMRSHLVEVLFGLGEYRLALPHYQKLLSGKEAGLSLLNRYAWCLYQTGKTGEAKSTFLKAKSLFSSEVERYRGSSTVQNMTEKLIAKRMAETYYGLALIHAKEGNAREGMKELSIALSLSPFFHSPDELLKFLRSYPQ